MPTNYLETLNKLPSSLSHLSPPLWSLGNPLSAPLKSVKFRILGHPAEFLTVRNEQNQAEHGETDGQSHKQQDGAKEAIRRRPIVQEKDHTKLGQVSVS